MPKIATLTSPTSFTVTDGLFKQTYPIVDSSTNLVSNADGSYTLYLLSGDEVVNIVSSTTNSPFSTNTIFGSSDPIVAQISAQVAIGAAGSGGGGGGGTSITQAEVKAAIESATNLDQLETLLGNLGTYTDGLEAVNTALNSYVDGLEGLETQIRDRLNAVSFATDTLQTTGNISLESIDTKLTALIDRIQNPGRGYSSTVIGTRAANITAYAANDVYGGVLEFTNIGPPGGVISLNNVQVIFDITALPAGMSAFRLYFYNALPGLVADNGAFSIPAGDRALLLNPSAAVFGAALAPGAGSVVGSITNINTQIKLAPGSTSLWAYAVTTTAFTPAAPSQTFRVTLSTLGI